MRLIINIVDALVKTALIKENSTKHQTKSTLFNETLQKYI